MVGRAGGVSNPRASSRQNNNGQSHTVTRREYWFTTTAQAAATLQTKVFRPTASGINVLDGIGKVYDNYKVLKADIEVHGIGATISKAVLRCAMDFCPTDKLPTTDAEIMKYVPSRALAAYQEARFSANAEQLQRRKMYAINGGSELDRLEKKMRAVNIAPEDRTMTVQELAAKYHLDRQEIAAVTGDDDNTSFLFHYKSSGSKATDDDPSFDVYINYAVTFMNPAPF